ncbi:MAG: ABC transporter permease [Oscillospiraceae bacterium]
MVKHRITAICKVLLQVVLTLFLLSVAVFAMSRLAPGDPLRSYYGESAERMSVSERENAMEKLGLDEPIYVQYGRWVENAVHGDFGISYKYKQDVTQVIGDVWANTLLLGGLAYLLTFVLALFLGILCARREDTLLDRVICKIGTITNSIPSFWVALVLILIFGVTLRWLPSSGAYPLGSPNDVMGRLRHLILPLTVLILSHLWYYAYMIRNKLLDEFKQDYVLLCRTKGLSQRSIIWKHCVRNIMPSFISLMAISVPHILGGTYIVEKVFSYPGLGTLCFESAKYHDYNMLLVLALLTGVIVVFANLLAQAVNSRVDPRMRQTKRGFLK